MTQARGSMSKVQIGFESTYATAATDGFIMPINSCTVAGTRAQHFAATIRGNLNPDEPFAGYTDVRGDVVVPMDSAAMWYWLKAMFGLPTTTGSGPYAHEFKIANGGTPFTLEKNFTDISQIGRNVGCKVGGWSLEVGGDGELVNSFSVTGANETLETTSFDATPTTVTLDRLKMFEASLEEGGSALTNAKVMSFNIDFKLDEDQFGIGSGGIRGDLPEQIVELSGQLQTLFENTTLLTKAENGTKSSLKLTITESASAKIEIYFPEIQYSKDYPKLEGPQGTTIDLGFQSFYNDGSNASAVVVTLTNSDEHATGV